MEFIDVLIRFYYVRISAAITGKTHVIQKTSRGVSCGI